MPAAGLSTGPRSSRSPPPPTCRPGRSAGISPPRSPSSPPSPTRSTNPSPRRWTAPTARHHRVRGAAAGPPARSSQPDGLPYDARTFNRMAVMIHIINASTPNSGGGARDPAGPADRTTIVMGRRMGLAPDHRPCGWSRTCGPSCTRRPCQDSAHPGNEPIEAAIVCERLATFDPVPPDLVPWENVRRQRPTPRKRADG